jgi:predicted ferric reductase
MKIGRFSTITLVVVSLSSLGVLLLLFFAPRGYLFGVRSLADLFGFLALALIAATGVLMLFKRSLNAWMGSPERLWRLHVVVAGAGGFFLGLHVVLFLAFPLSLPVLLGYAATGAALFVWITGGIYFQGVRNSMFLHGLLSIGAIFLILVHTFGAGRNIPAELSGVSLALTAVALLAGVSLKLATAWKADGSSHV